MELFKQQQNDAQKRFKHFNRAVAMNKTKPKYH